MGQAWAALRALGCVGSEYRQPLGLVLDFVAGSVPNQPPNPNAPVPQLDSLQRGWNDVMEFGTVCKATSDVVEAWGQGP